MKNNKHKSASMARHADGAFFYVPDVDGVQNTLNEEESAHVACVLRLKTGDNIMLTDGKGGLYRAVIVEPHHKRCRIEVVEQRSNRDKRPYRLHIAIAPTKNIDRFEWFIEKATEIGIDEITPLLCEHSERKQINVERLRRIMIAAIKQSQKADLPQLNEMTDFDRWLKTQNAAEQRYIAHCNEGERQPLKTLYKPPENVVIAIGPEGDFSMAETIKSADYGFEGISLGTSRLRTETAGVIACHAVYFMNE